MKSAAQQTTISQRVKDNVNQTAKGGYIFTITELWAALAALPHHLSFPVNSRKLWKQSQLQWWPSIACSKECCLKIWCCSSIIGGEAHSTHAGWQWKREWLALICIIVWSFANLSSFLCRWVSLYSTGKENQGDWRWGQVQSSLRTKSVQFLDSQLWPEMSERTLAKLWEKMNSDLHRLKGEVVTARDWTQSTVFGLVVQVIILNSLSSVLSIHTTSGEQRDGVTRRQTEYLSVGYISGRHTVKNMYWKTMLEELTNTEND